MHRQQGINLSMVISLTFLQMKSSKEEEKERKPNLLASKC